MSSLLRPVGHLPASVYWVRRAILLAVLLALVLVLFRVIGGGGQKPAAASEALGSPTPGPSSPLTPSPGTPVPGGDRTNDPTGDPTPGSDPSSSSTAGPGATRDDDGRCTGGNVRLTVTPAARTVSAGRPLNLQVNLSTTRQGGCQAVVDARRLELKITSGKDRIWTTRHCEKTVPKATLALTTGKQSTTTVTWNGRRSAAQCRGGQPTAKPGTYVVQAVYDGRTSTEQAFKVA